MGDKLNLKLKVWRQKGPTASGKFETYAVQEISPHISFLEMLDLLNAELLAKGDEPVVF